MVGAFALVITVVLSAAWDLHRIRSELSAGRRALDGLSLDLAASTGLSASSEDAASHLRRGADRADHSVALDLIGQLPVLDRQVRAIRRMTDVTAQLGTSAVTAAHRLDAQLQRADEPSGRIALLDVATAEIDRMSAELATAELGRPDGLVGPLRAAHDDLAASIRSARDKLAKSRSLVRPLRDVLKGPSTFLLLAANNAEMAGGSGLALSAGALTFDQGEIRLGDVVPAGDLRLPEAVALPGDLGSIYGPTGIGIDLRSATRSPNLPVMGPVIVDMLAARGFPGLDGVLVVDALALADILEVSGGVTVRGTKVDADNVLPEVLHENYRHFDVAGDQDDRASYQGEIAKAVFESLTNRGVPALDLAEALLNASRGRHLQLWGADPALQQTWEDLGVAGALHPRGLMISFQNYGADKMDWYLRPTAELDVRLLPSGDYRARLTMSMRVPTRTETRDASPYILGPDPDTHGVFLTVHLPALAYDITTPDPSGFRTKGLDPPMQVRTFLDEVDAGATLERHLDFTLPRRVSSMALLPSARMVPLRLTVDGKAVVDDATPRWVTWGAALPAPPGDDRPSLWVRALVLAGLAASVVATGSGLAGGLLRRAGGDDARRWLVVTRNAAVIALVCLALAGILALVLATPRV